jgi:hypothetical protein
LKRNSSFWSSAVRRKEADRVGFETQIQKPKKGEEEWLRAPYAERERESKRRKIAQTTIKYSLMVELGSGTKQRGTLPDEQVMGFQF